MGLLYRPRSHNKVFIIISIVLGVPFLTGTIEAGPCYCISMIIVVIVLYIWLDMFVSLLDPGSVSSHTGEGGRGGGPASYLRDVLAVFCLDTPRGPRELLPLPARERLRAEAQGEGGFRCSLTAHPSGGAFGVLGVGRNSCWTVAPTPTLNDPRPVPGCTTCGTGLPEQRLLQAPDRVALLTLVS